MSKCNRGEIVAANCSRREEWGERQVPHRDLVGRHERSTVDSANDFAGWTC